MIFCREHVGNTPNDPFTAYQEAAKAISAKKGSASKIVSGDEVVVTRSRHATVVKVEPTSSSQGRRPRGGDVTTRSA